LKEQEENQLDQDNDEILYTYARDNERKVKFNYPYSSMQSILVASKLRPDENNFDISHSYFSSSLPSFLPSLSPAYIQHSSQTNDNYSPVISSPPVVTQTTSCVKKNTDDYMNSPVILRMDVDLHSNCKPKPSTSSSQQQILIVNSLQSLNSLTERSVITFMNKKSILKILSRSHLVGQPFVFKTSGQTNEE
jgi:hypothetical protein